MKKHFIIIYILIAAVSLAYVISVVVKRLPAVGMGRNSKSINESKKRNVFVGFYKVAQNDSFMDIHPKTIIWAERYYKTMSWDVRETTVTKGLYSLYVDRVPAVRKEIKNDLLILTKDSSENIFSSDGVESSRITLEFHESSGIPDTIVVYVRKKTKTFQAYYRDYPLIDSFRIYRIRN